MARNPYAIGSVVLAFLTIAVSMMLSVAGEAVLGIIGILLALAAFGCGIMGIIRYAGDKTIKGLGFSIAGIILSLWALGTILLKM